MARIFFLLSLLAARALSQSCPAWVSNEGSGECVYLLRISDYVTLNECGEFDDWIQAFADQLGGVNTEDESYKLGTIMGPITDENIVGTKGVIRIKGDEVDGRYRFKFKDRANAALFKSCLMDLMEFFPMQSEGCCMPVPTSAPTSG